MLRRTPLRHRLSLCAALATSAGCAGSKADVTFPNSASPISLSSTIRSSDGSILDDNDLQVVGSFETKFKRSWAIFYSAARFRKEIDFSDEINEAVSVNGGDAVTNLEVRAFNCNMNFIIPLTLLPVWPGCVKVKLAGKVVKHVPAAPAAAPEPEPEPELEPEPEPKPAVEDAPPPSEALKDDGPPEGGAEEPVKS